MTRVLLTEIFPPQPGGSGRWLAEVYRRFRGHQIVITRSTVRPISTDPPYVRRIPFELQDTGGLTRRGAAGYSALLRRIRSEIDGSGRLTVQAARVVPEGWLAFLWRLRGGPRYQCFAHGEEINLDGAASGGVMSSRQHRWMAWLVLRAAESVIANSENTASILRNQWRVPERKVRVVHPGVDTGYFVPPDDLGSARDQLGWGGRRVILTVGRLQTRKGHDRVIESLPELLKRFPSLLYVVIGDGPDRDRLHRLAKELSIEHSIEWHPCSTDEEMLRMYQACDLFVLANRQIGSDVEGFGMVLLEAAACGKATIAGASGGTREAIVDGVTGLLVDGDSSECIIDAISDLLQDAERRHAMGAAGRERAVSEFDWQALATRLEQELDSV